MLSKASLESAENANIFIYFPRSDLKFLKSLQELEKKRSKGR